MRTLIKASVIGAIAMALVVLGTQGPATPAEASEQTTTVYWGNYDVAAFSQPSSLYFDVQKPCTDCYITSVTPDLEYDSDPGAGVVWTQATYSVGAMLHHMVIFNQALVDATCAGTQFGSLGDRFFASGDERGTLAFLPGYGYYLPPNVPSYLWNLNVMIHNVSPSQKTFRLKMTFKYYPGADNLKPMRHLWLDEGNCGSSEYAVPVGYKDDHWSWTSGGVPSQTADDVEGKIMMMGGHVHDWGVSVAATLGATATSGPVMCAAVGGYAMGSTFAPATVSSPPVPSGAHPTDNIDLNPGNPSYSGHIESMTGCLPNVMIKPGDTIWLHTQYNTTAPVPDVMGIMNAWVYDNCFAVSNPSQSDVDVDQFGDPCDPDMDGDGTMNVSDADDDNDGFDDSAESGTPLCTGSANEDAFSGESMVNDGCPAVGPAESICTGAADDDADAFINDGCTQVGTYAEGAFNIGTNSVGRCGAGNLSDPSPSWPLDFVSISTPDSTDKVSLVDLTSFLASPRRFDTSPGNANFNKRWDLLPGPGGFANWINLQDLTALIAGATGYPAMFDPDGPGGQPAPRAFGNPGPQCTGD